LQLAIEAIENVQTIQLLTRETDFCSKFRRASDAPKRAEMSNVLLEGFAFAVSQCFIYFMQCVGYGLGLYLIIQHSESGTHVFQLVFYTNYQLNNVRLSDLSKH
jgi:hypothetical protein